MQGWMHRELPRLAPPRDVLDSYADHHIALVKCRGCEHQAVAVYPVECDVLRMECPFCGVRDSEIVQYVKRVWKQ
jgi:hypothetical protein